jgi:hypothetical protein
MIATIEIRIVERPNAIATIVSIDRDAVIR